MLRVLTRFKNTPNANRLAWLVGAAYLLAALHGLPLGIAHQHENDDHGGPTAAATKASELAASPVCPHQLPELAHEAHEDCALCKLSRTLLGREDRAKVAVPSKVSTSVAVEAPSIPSRLDDWRPASLRGPPTRA